ncbi:MAG TPA: hypothetical protein VFV37_10515 [Luteibaculaceae bacterium]|nr:hypothetical protein [Luteibaculaceae bacterium]
MKASLIYPQKVLIAWGEAIKGNKAIADWLMKNGYPELGLFCFAVRNNDDAREWLMKNGFPHLMAVINGAEGIKEAISWLEGHKFEALAKVAAAGDGDLEAYKWLKDRQQVELCFIAKNIRDVKDMIEFDNNDPHRISRD